MKPFFSTAFLLLALAGCTKHEVETLTSEPLSDYLPLVVGKTITYRLDSTVFTNFGHAEETHSYQEKQEVAAQITDNLGRPSYSIRRYLRDSAGSQPWRAAGSFFITPSEKAVEVVENNLRTVRLALPIRQDYTWTGNEYLPYKPYGGVYDFLSDVNFNPSIWEFFYESLGQTVVLNNQSIDGVLTVKHIDEESRPVDDIFVTGKTYSEDKYAKGIGLVYQQLIMWELEPGTDGSGPFKVGFGVTRTMLSHD